MEQAIQHGADIIIRDWVRLRAGERLLIVSSQKYAVEVAAMQQAAQTVGGVADVLMLDDLHEQVGQYFDDREDAFDPYNAVIGAAEYSLITTRAVKRVIARRNRGLNSSFIVRKISSGEGVERTFQLYSPMIASIEVKRFGDVRRDKLYYLRERSGKAARIKERLVRKD